MRGDGVLGDKEQVKRKSKKQEGGQLGYQVSSEEKEMSPERCPPADRSAVSVKQALRL
jgi:hypothetical protein